MLSPPTYNLAYGRNLCFTKFYKALKPEGILTTYCVKGTVKQALRNIGFNLKRLPGPRETGDVESSEMIS
ncbi:MAG: MnmC family methyltransferase [Butyricimonas faecihominis]